MAVLGESQIYRDLMRFKPVDMSPNAWAVKAGVSRTVWTDMRRHGNPSRRTLEKLLVAAGSSLLEFEALRLGPEPRRLVSNPPGRHVADERWTWSGAPLPQLPLISSSLGGEWGDPGSGVEITEIHPGRLLERLPRPVSLGHDAEAYAVTIVGASMWPRFRAGSRVAVSPRSPVTIGDDVLVRVRGSAEYQGEGAERVLIMRLVKRGSASLELRQFNPDQIICVSTDEVEAVVRIAGELI
jgi:Peptidase S24-like